MRCGDSPSRKCDLFVTPAALEVSLLNGDGATAGVEPSWLDDGPELNAHALRDCYAFSTSDTLH
jgi:hypothetical protein